MKSFIHRILRSRTASAVSNQHGQQFSAVNQLVSELKNAKLIYFGEFHSENRIVEFQTELIRKWRESLKPPQRLHVVMEHFSIDMQQILDTFRQSEETDEAAFEQLLCSYQDVGTEGHDLKPYKDLLLHARRDKGVQVLLHGGFIPRNHASRLNKECKDIESKKEFFAKMGETYLPSQLDPMYGALFEEQSTYKLRGRPEHEMLIQSLMQGTDLYSPVDGEKMSKDDEEAEESPMSRLYQAQLLKDHAMAYRIANLMLDHYQEHKSLNNDRYLVIAGFGHLKHRLGVPDCLMGYLREEALRNIDQSRRGAAMDLLLSLTDTPVMSSSNHNQTRGSSLIGCQMMYEAYLEDNYPLLQDAIEKAGDDDDEIERLKCQMTKELYLKNPKKLDECILKSDEIRSPLLSYAAGVAGFQYPSSDYLFLYDEDDDNVLTDADLTSDQDECPFSNDAKDETRAAYESVGKSAGLKGSAAKARAIMGQIGYKEEDMAYIGDDDLYNYQGVANPHLVAKIKPGETVLDCGSGLGIDSFLAMRDCGADKFVDESSESHDLVAPFVFGVDLSGTEVAHTNKRSAERGYSPKRIRFTQGDIEKLYLPYKFDVVISNGAFCLIPSKQKAFESVFNALKPGGRIAISQTTIKTDGLDPNYEWPVCMRMFAKLDTLEPMLTRIGYQNVAVIDAESPMEGIEIPIEAAEESASSERFKIHGKYADQYEFLDEHDMDELCKIVTVYAEKPM